MTPQRHPGGRALRVLLAWELGANLGHLLRMEPVAQALRERGAEVVWAVPDPASARRSLREPAWQMLRIPRSVMPIDHEPVCYAEILAAHGFGSDAMLNRSMQAWAHLLDQVRPDAMLVDHSPPALLAAHLHDTPALHLATGWESPPAMPHLPILRPDTHQDDAGHVASLESQLLARVNRLCDSHGAARLGLLAEVFRAHACLIAGLPETDHFAPRPDRPWFAEGDPRRQPLYVGPLFSADTGADARWPVVDAPGVYVYMQRGEATSAVLGMLEETRCAVLAVVPGGVDARPHPARRLHDAPVKLGQALKHAALVICHGSHGIVAASLLAGVPLLVIPTQMEQELLGRRVEALGAGLMVAPGRLFAEFKLAVDRLLVDPRHRASAQGVASRYRGFDSKGVARRIAMTLEEMGQRRWHRPSGRDAGPAGARSPDL